jgi:hypothetical protein
VSQKEFQRVKVIDNAVSGRLSASEAARLLQLSERQVQWSSCAFAPTPWPGCITAIVDGPSPGLCLQVCAGRSSNWPATSMPPSTILIFWEKLRVVGEPARQS